MSFSGCTFQRSQCVTASIEVLGATILPGRWKVIGVARVEIVLDGVSIVLQGVRILRRADGRPPWSRHALATPMVPAVALPEDLEEAMARGTVDRSGSDGRGWRWKRNRSQPVASQ